MKDDTPNEWQPRESGHSQTHVRQIDLRLKKRFSSVQSLSHVWLFATPWTAAHQASLSITNSQSLLKLMSNQSVMPSNYLTLCCPLLLLPSIFPSIRVFSKESVLHIRWPRYWSFSFQHHPSNENPGLISLGWTGWISLQSKGLSRVFSNTIVQILVIKISGKTLSLYIFRIYHISFVSTFSIFLFSVIF